MRCAAGERARAGVVSRSGWLLPRSCLAACSQVTKQASTTRLLPNTHEAAQSGTRGTGTCQPAAEAAADPAPAGMPQAEARGGKVAAAAAYTQGLHYPPVRSNWRIWYRYTGLI